MTKTLTTEAMQDIYEAAVREEATGNPDESGEEAFDLLYLLDSTGGTGATIRKLIDLVRAANREAQPVGWTDAQELRDVEKDGCGYLFKANPITPHADPRRVIKLYTAPPAPAVPDDIAGIIKRFQQQCGHPIDWRYIDEHSCKVNRLDWLAVMTFLNACRAAMLAQPVSHGCKWTYDEQDYKWDSGCGEAWMFSDGGPTENGVKFCQSCGKPVLLAAAPASN